MGLLRALEVALEQRGHLEALPAFRRRHTQDHVQGGYGRQAKIKVQTVAAANEDRRGIFNFGSSGVVRRQVNHVQRTIDLGGSIGRAGLTDRWRVYGIPRLGYGGDEVGAGIERCEFERAQIVGLIGSIAHGAADAGAVVVAPERDRGGAYRFSGFVEDVAGEHRRAHQPQREVFGVHTRAGHDGSGKLLVLVVGGADVSPLGAVQGIFSGRKVAEFEVAVVAGDHESLVLAVPDVLQRNPRAGKWMTLRGADDGAGNAEMADAHGNFLKGLRDQGDVRSQEQAAECHARYQAARFLLRHSTSSTESTQAVIPSSGQSLPGTARRKVLPGKTASALDPLVFLSARIGLTCESVPEDLQSACDTVVACRQQVPRLRGVARERAILLRSG